MLRATFPNPVGQPPATTGWPGLAGPCPSGFWPPGAGTGDALPQPGNPRPRHLPPGEDQAVINRMGFPRSRRGVPWHSVCRERGRPGFGAGVNIGKNKVTPLEVLLVTTSPCFGPSLVSADSPRQRKLPTLPPCAASRRGGRWRQLLTPCSAARQEEADGCINPFRCW